MSRRSVVKTTVRVVVGVVALAVGGGVVAGAATVTLPSLTETPAGRVVTPVALDQQRVCSGSLLQLAGDTGASATTVTAEGAATVTSGASGSTPATATTLTGADGSSSSPQLISAGSSSTIPLLSGVQFQSIQTSDLSGVAASPCAEPTSSSWLVGGSTETGRTTLIDLVNPSDVNSTVDLSIWGEDGQVTGPGLTGIVVAPRSQKVVPLAGFATGLVSPVVHVTSRGGQIAASLQENVVRTLQPGGVDTISASAGPSTKQVVAGIDVLDGSAIQGLLGDPGYSDLKTILRVYVPGTATAQLSIQVSTANGTGATFSVTAVGGRVTDVPLDGLPDGVYTATVQSTQPVVTGARSSAVSRSSAVDLAWVGAAPALSGATQFSVSSGAPSTLTLANPTAKPITATLTGSSPKKITVAAGSSAAVALPLGVQETLMGADGLHAAVTYASGVGIAAYPLSSSTPVSTPVKVYP